MRKEIVNPDMDLSKVRVSSANTGGKIDTGSREQVNPDMDLSTEGAAGEPQALERKDAVMPGVGKMPTGMQAVKKTPSGYGLDE